MTLAVSPLVRLRGGRQDELLVCIPCAGSGISIFNEWPQLLGSDFWLALIQLPGREDRLGDRLSQTSLEIATDIAGEIERLNPVRVTFFGHSMGAILAWLAATTLWKKFGRSSTVVVAAQSPDFEAPNSIGDLTGLRRWFVKMGEPWPRDLYDPEVRALFLHVLNQDLKWLGDQKGCLNADEAAPLSLHCLFGEQDTLVNRQAMNSWIKMTCGNFSLSRMEGGHLFLLGRSKEITDYIKHLLAYENQNGERLYA